MKFYYRKMLVCIGSVLALLLCLSGCGNHTAQDKIFSDRVYVKDHLFTSDGETVEILPDNYICIGTVETSLSKNEPVEINNASNFLNVGSKLYLPEGIDLENITSPIKLYGKNESDIEYEIFSLMLAIG